MRVNSSPDMQVSNLQPCDNLRGIKQHRLQEHLFHVVSTPETIIVTMNEPTTCFWKSSATLESPSLFGSKWMLGLGVRSFTYSFKLIKTKLWSLCYCYPLLTIPLFVPCAFRRGKLSLRCLFTRWILTTYLTIRRPLRFFVSRFRCPWSETLQPFPVILRNWYLESS